MSERTIIMLILAGLIIIGIVVFRKQIAKLVLLLSIGVVGITAVNMYAPDKVKVVGTYVYHAKEMAEVAKQSDKVKIETEDGEIKNVQVKIEDKWYSLEDIEKLQKNLKGGYTVTVGGQSITINDKKINQVLAMVKKYR